MKRYKLTTALAGIAAAAILSTSAHAQVYTTYTSGDLFLGFEQSGNASDYLVDLGQATQFIDATHPLTFQLSAGTSGDLPTIFGTNWASNSQTNLVQWGVIGNDQSQNIASDPDGNTIWYTKGETVAGTQTTPPTRGTGSALTNLSNTIQNLETASTGGYANTLSTANGNNAIVESSSAANSWTSFHPGTYSGGTAFGIGTEIEQPGSGSDTGPTDSVLDLYQVNTRTGTNQPADFLGTLSLSSAGVLTFDPESVPEPSAYALGITAVVLLVVLNRRKSMLSA
jgi:hypothetical protein